MAIRMSLWAMSVCFLAAGSALADDAADKPRERGPRNPERMQKLLDEFDADGDGKLNKEERTAAREARMAQRAEKGEKGAKKDAAKRGARRPGGDRGERGPGGPPRMPDPATLFDKIDADGDGSINKEQFIAFMEKMREERMLGRGPRGEGRPPQADRRRGGPPRGPRGEGRPPRGRGPGPGPGDRPDRGPEGAELD